MTPNPNADKVHIFNASSPTFLFITKSTTIFFVVSCLGYLVYRKFGNKWSVNNCRITVSLSIPNWVVVSSPFHIGRVPPPSSPFTWKLVVRLEGVSRNITKYIVPSSSRHLVWHTCRSRSSLVTERERENERETGTG